MCLAMAATCLAVALPCRVAQATTYYVANDGSDESGQGTELAPWRTLAHATAQMSAGDTLLLRRGDIWRETLTVPVSGTAQQDTVFGAYGTGDNPKIVRTDYYSNFWLHSFVVNGGFEVFTDGSPDTVHYWSLATDEGPANGSYVDIVSSPHNRGSYAAKLHRDGYNARLWQTLELEPSTEYFIEFWGFKDSANVGNGKVLVKDGTNNRCLTSAGWSSCTGSPTWDALDISQVASSFESGHRISAWFTTLGDSQGPLDFQIRFQNYD